MSLPNTLNLINDEVKTMIASNFTVNLSLTDVVPSIDNSGLTFPSVSNQKIDTLELTTCVLFIDIRKSTEISANHQNKTLVKLYSAFVRSMVKAANYHGGKVRNIIGDRVMVVFDKEDCVKNAVNTAILLNSVSKFIINKHFKHNEIECGIGVDYGKMQVVKTGSKKNGEENREYKALVWLGNTANIASKLTDLANKTTDYNTYEIEYLDNISYLFDNIMPIYESPFNSIPKSDKKGPKTEKRVISEKEFLKNIRQSSTGISYLGYGDIKSFKIISNTKSSKPILITQIVHTILTEEYPELEYVKKNHWKLQSHLDNSFYNKKIYGADTFNVAAKNL